MAVYCPNCANALNILNERFYNAPLLSCPNCNALYFIDSKNQLIRLNLADFDDDENEANEGNQGAINYYSQPQNQSTQIPVSSPVSNLTENQTRTGKSFSNKSGVLVKKAVAHLCVSIFIAALLSVIAFVVKFDLAPVVLLMSGFVLLIYGIILCVVLPKKARKICPCCGTKREHHRRYVSTTHKTTNYNSGQNYTTKFTHHYIDTYVCPNCGETGEYKETGSGGEKRFTSQYGYIDKYIDPREF